MITIRGKEKSGMLYLIRHGETDWNKEHRIQGQRDIPMNSDGISQITELAEKLGKAGITVDAVICSPLSRAKDTASIIADRIGFTGQIEYDPGFIERDFGLLEGVVWTPETNFDDPQYKMESIKELCERVKRAFAKYSFADDKKVMIVSHGAFLAATKMVLSDGKLPYTDKTVPIIQGNVLCYEIDSAGEANLYNLF